MYPHMNEQMVSAHVRDLRTQAERSRMIAQAKHNTECTACAPAQHSGPHPMRPAQRSTVRHRAGWTLVAIGLRLAGTSPES
jgi:hypothetical protein